MEPYEPYEEPTEALEGPHFTLDTPFANYMYIAPSQWTYQCPPLSPPLQPEMVANQIIQWPQPSISPPGTLAHPLPVTRTCPGDEISCQLTRSKPAPKGHPSQPNQPGKSPGGLTI